MGWIEGFNDAMDYIEANLEGDLDLAHAARLAACTEGQFRRMFSYIAGIGLMEYVRRRRISRAALDLSRGERVVDVAVRYGYCSPTAFNRAFRDALGISPSEAKRPGAPLSIFPRLSFSLTVTGAEPLPWRIVLGLATLMWTVPGGARETGGPYMRDPRHPRHFTDEFKRQIVDLYNAGKPKREIMDEYDLGKSTVERWIKSINATGSPRAADNRTPEQNRILELERENRRLRMEVDVLKQAALIYARK